MAISVSGSWTAGADGGRPAAAACLLTPAVTDDFAAVKDVWRRLAGQGHATPYQSYAFCEAYFRHVEAAEGARAAIVVLHDAGREPVALLPLSVRRAGPFRVAHFIGGRQSNFNMPLFGRAGEAIGRDPLRASLVAAGRLMNVDALILHAQPRVWDGFANPMAALASMDSPSNGYRLSLEANADTVFARQLSKDTRRKLRQKAQKLARIGDVRFDRPSGADAQAALADFFRLKADRFAAQGIADPFAQPSVRAFLSEAVATPSPTIELHTLRVGGRLVAVFGGVVHAGRFSALLTAFDSDEAISRCSPGDILLTELIRDCCARGLATFDLGVGEAHYKDKICDAEEPLFESFVPVTPAGQAIVAASLATMVLKRAIKTSDVGRRALALMRAIRSRRRAGT